MPKYFTFLGGAGGGGVNHASDHQAAVEAVVQRVADPSHPAEWGSVRTVGNSNQGDGKYTFVAPVPDGDGGTGWPS